MLSSPITQTRENYVVIPLDEDIVPYLCFLSPEEQQADAIYIHLKMIKYLATLPGLKDQKFFIPVKKLVENHRNTKKKTHYRKMPDPLGFGTFAKSDIATGDYIVCAGQMEYAGSNNFSHYSISIFRDKVIPSTHELTYNAKHCQTPSKYIQHLPTGNTFVRNGETYSANANFFPNTCYTQITIGKATYTIPIVRLIAQEDIIAGSMFGYDYGFDHWRKLGSHFTYLDCTGKPLTIYHVECFNPRDNDHIVIPLNIAAFRQLICDSYIEIEASNTYYGFTKESNEYLTALCQVTSNQSGSVRIELPAIFGLHKKHFTIIEDMIYTVVHNGVTLELPNSKLVKHFKIESLIADSTAHKGITIATICFPLENFLNSSVEMMLNLKRFLMKKNLISEDSFEINIDPAMLAEIKEKTTSPSHLSEYGLFKDTATRLLSSLPAAVLDKVVDLDQYLYLRRK